MREHLTQDEAYEFLIAAQRRRQESLDSGEMEGQINAAKDCGVGCNGS